jgi:hypothetical protein
VAANAAGGFIPYRAGGGLPVFLTRQ